MSTTEQSDIEAIQQAIGKLLQASSQEEAIQIVRENPELLKEQADMVLEIIIGQAKAEGNNDLVGVLENRREFLRAVKASAKEQQNGTQQSDDLSALQEAFQALVNASGNPEEIAAVIAKHPVLLSDKADAMFEMMVNEAKEQRDEDTVRAIEMLRELVRQFRQATPGHESSARSQANMAHQSNDDDQIALQEALQALMNISSPEEMTTVVTKHPVLLTDKTDALFEMMSNAAKAHGDNNAVQQIDNMREMLKIIRQTLAEQE